MSFPTLQRAYVKACLVAAAALGGCGATEDTVFIPITVAFDTAAPHVAENSGVSELQLRLSVASPEPVSVPYALRAGDAQSSCPARDFEASSGTLVFAPGELRAQIPLLVTDDDLAETDEYFSVEIGVPQGAIWDGPRSRPVVIEDDDRTRLIDAAAEFSVTPGSANDSTSALQAALAAAAESGRGVVVVAPGDYEVKTLEVPLGITVSARGAVFHRPAAADPLTVTLRVAYAGAEDSLPTLIEGASIDGRRDEQGEFRDYAMQEAHLLQISADSATAGRARVALEGLSLRSGTGDGVAVRDNADVTLCDISGHDLWRELLGVIGGNISVIGTNLTGSASEGTSGLWFGSTPTGFAASGVLDAEVEDVTLSSGDLELELSGGSSFRARRLKMAQAPLRLTAPDSSVRIQDSVLMTGVPSLSHNYIRVPHDVEIVNSTLVLSERTDELDLTKETERSLVFGAVGFGLDLDSPLVPGSHQLLFDNCQFVLAPDVEADDRVSVISAGPGGSVIVRGSSYGPGIAGWFADPCADCQLQ